MALTPTPSQTVGPFFHLGCTQHRSIGSLVAASTQGERIQLTCCVLDGDGVPVNDAMIEIWQANAEGKYNHPEDTQDKSADPSFRGFGRLATNDNGECTFQTIKPGRVATNGKLQAAHINVSVFARGLLNRLVTRIYFAGDPAVEQDNVFKLAPDDRRDTLLAYQKNDRPNEWQFEIHLCGERETVFFDI